MTAPPAAAAAAAADWPDGSLLSPVTGAPLARDGDAMVAPGERWPVLDGIPYLRTGRERLVAEVLAALDAGDRTGALAPLLADQDDWSPTSPPSPQDARAVAAGAPGATTLRDAMRLLAYGPVADYFAHRAGDPVLLAGLGLVRAGWAGPRTSFELACGVGHHLRVLAGAGVAVAGGDVVFSKLWLARRHLAPDARLVCFDAAAPWPLGDATYDLVTCHDALYFLPDKAAVADRLRGLAGPTGTVAVSHAHNVRVETHGDPLEVAGYAALFAGAALFDDAALQAALLDDEPPAPAPVERLQSSEAVGLLAGAADVTAPDGIAAAWQRAPDLALPPAGTPLRLHPLLAAAGPGATAPAWPSARYASEYGPRSAHLHLDAPVAEDLLARAAAGAVGSDPQVDALARRRVLVDLPATW